jgi:hypothetical protein
MFRAALARLTLPKSHQNKRQFSFPKPRWKRLSKSLRKPLEKRDTERSVSGLHRVLCDETTLYFISQLRDSREILLLQRQACGKRSLFFHIDKRF